MGTPVDVIVSAAKNEIEMPPLVAGLGEDVEEAVDEQDGDDTGGDTEGDREGGEDTAADAGDGEGDEGARSEDAADTSAEAAGEEKTAEQSADDSVATRLAAIAEAEQEVRVSLARLKRREQEVEQIYAQSQEAQKSVANVSAAVKADPFGFLEKAGVPFDTLLEMVSNNQGAIPKPTGPVAPVEDEMPAWAKKLEQKIDTVAQHRQQEVSQEGERRYRAMIGDALKSDKYADLRSMRKADDTIYGIAEAHAAQTGEVLPVEVIADTLQEEWREQLSDLPNHESTRKLLNLAQPQSGQSPKSKPKRESGSPESEDTSLSGDLTPGKRPRKKAKSRTEEIAWAAGQLKGDNLWGEISDEDDDD